MRLDRSGAEAVRIALLLRRSRCRRTPQLLSLTGRTAAVLTRKVLCAFLSLCGEPIPPGSNPTWSCEKSRYDHRKESKSPALKYFPRPYQIAPSANKPVPSAIISLKTLFDALEVDVLNVEAVGILVDVRGR